MGGVKGGPEDSRFLIVTETQRRVRGWHRGSAWLLGLRLAARPWGGPGLPRPPRPRSVGYASLTPWRAGRGLGVRGLDRSGREHKSGG